MQEIKRKSIDFNTNSKSSVIPWSFETNWVIAQGSLEDSVTVESSDYPICESGPENSSRKPPLVLKPRVPNSGPCEIKICFQRKYEAGQIYVRSTARTYEIYCTHSPYSINEYLCTVRCGVAERDGKVLKTSCNEDVAGEHREDPLGEVTAETATGGENTVTSEDDWINIKVPEIGRGSASKKISTSGLKNIQDFHEATAQISDSNPCLSLTIRLLLLQDKEHVCIDEIYAFMDPAESNDSENEALMTGSSTGSSLMAMFMPTLLQLSKSGVSRIQDKCASDEVLNDGKMETESRIIAKIDGNEQYVKPQALDKHSAESSELQQHTSAKKCGQPEVVDDLPPGHLEIALEQLIARLSRVEDICLRFEEKMLKPIERVEARLQKVENQLEKLARNAHDFGLPHCTRISAPAFSCSESTSSSFYNNRSDHLPCGASDLEKMNFSCHNTPKLSHDANFYPSVAVSAPEFSCGEGEKENEDLSPLKDNPYTKSKKTLSIDDALAAALNGFLSTAASDPSENIQTTLGLSIQVNEENQYKGDAESCQIKTRELSAAENGNGESSQYTQVLTIKAPDFTTEETGNEEHVNYTHSSSDMVSVTKNEDHHGDEIVPRNAESIALSTSAGLCGFGKNESADYFTLTSNVDVPTVSVNASGTRIGNGHFNENSEVNMIDSHLEGGTSSVPAGTSNGSALDLTKDSVKTDRHQVSDETNPSPKSTCFNADDQDNSSELVLEQGSDCVSEVLERHVEVDKCLKDNIPNISESPHAALLDFEFPILEVKFTSDVYTSTKSPLEALLDGVAESNTEASSVNINVKDGSVAEQTIAVIMNGNEKADLLVDMGVSAADGSSSLKGMSHNLCTTSNPEMDASLI